MQGCTSAFMLGNRHLRNLNIHGLQCVKRKKRKKSSVKHSTAKEIQFSFTHLTSPKLNLKIHI
jgi:hypothetical protein